MLFGVLRVERERLFCFYLRSLLRSFNGVSA